MTTKYLWEDDDELTHRLVYIGALVWPSEEQKGCRLASTEQLDEIASRYGLERHKRPNPDYVEPSYSLPAITYVHSYNLDSL